MAGHVQLKLVMTECSKTQIRLTGLNYRLVMYSIDIEDALNVTVISVGVLEIFSKMTCFIESK